MPVHNGDIMRFHAARAAMVTHMPMVKRQTDDASIASAASEVTGDSSILSDVSDSIASDSSVGTVDASFTSAALASAATGTESDNLEWQSSYSAMAASLAANPSLINDPAYQSAFASAFGQSGAALLSEYSTSGIDASSAASAVASIASDSSGASSATDASTISSASDGTSTSTKTKSASTMSSTSSTDEETSTSAAEASSSASSDNDDDDSFGMRLQAKYGWVGVAAIFAGYFATM